MKVYRIERRKNLENPLSGLGASRAQGNRWNSLGTELVYTSESRALATLEIVVHLDLSEDLPTDRYYVQIEIPDDITILEVDSKDLPTDWDAKPPSVFTQSIGDEFRAGNEAAVLKVPSSIVPQEYNYLINPAHPESKRIKVTDTTSMTLDTRIKVK